jgi:DNA-binding NarL/FixJ family response regulator
MSHFARARQYLGRASLDRLRVVVADDNAAFLRELVSVLSLEFDVVAKAEDGRAALDLVCRHRPDLVVLDMHMPGLSGIEVAAQLAKDSGSPPVVICSVETDSEVLEAARKAGARAYVFKSRIETDLILAAKSVLRNRVFV